MTRSLALAALLIVSGAIRTAGPNATPVPAVRQLLSPAPSPAPVALSIPSAAAQPVRATSRPLGLGSAASTTGNSSAIPKGSIRGIASWMPERYGARYLALPEGAGHRVTVCGAAACVTMTSNDAGPSLAMQRKGRIVDLSAALFKRVTGLPLSRGIAWVTVRRER